MALLLDSLRSVEFLAGLPEEDVLRFMVLGKSVEYAKHHVFWKSGNSPEMLVIPISGEAKTATFSSEGREFIDRFLASGECIGLASCLDAMPHPTDAEVVRAGEFFTISRTNFLKFLQDRPSVRSKATEMIGALYRRNLKEREDVALRPVPQRLAAFLLQHTCVRQADGAKVLVHATQAELAARLGTVREVVARILADFTQRGLLDRVDDSMFIADWDGMHAEAGFESPADEELLSRSGGPVSSTVRTARFFLPTVERRKRGGGESEASKCQDHLGDLNLCRDRGCPGANETPKKRPAAK